MPDVLLIEPCNFEDFPVGGQLSSAKQMMKVFGNRLALVGICTDDTPIGRWAKRNFDGVEYNFFAVGRMIPSSRKPFIPGRLTAYLWIKKYKRQILSLEIRSVFIRTSEVLLAVKDWGWNSVCYELAGLNNPLVMPRYSWAKLFAGLYGKRFLSALRAVDVVLAAGDRNAIDEFVANSAGLFSRQRIIQFPTRVDTDIFHPIPSECAKAVIGLEGRRPIVTTCGRINWVKGWEFIIETFQLFNRVWPEAMLIFVGDGEDRPRLEKKIERQGLASCVKITGFLPHEKVAVYLSASDLCVVGSLKEGWSLAMLEALACGKPIVSTDVSGARDMIVEGGNGYIVEKRDPKCFADAMNRALAIKGAQEISLRVAEKYAVKNLARDLGRLWHALQ
jgi:glycosyltransferase involved in cell wall biosynthesis